jgi:hypothetical protein
MSKPFQVTNWRPFQKNTLQGFFSLTLPSGMTINDCTFHVKKFPDSTLNEAKWIGLPGKPYTKPDKSTSWTPVVEISDRDIRDHFQATAVAAVEEYLATTK